MKSLTKAALERRAKFLKMLELYYLDKRDLSHIARTLGVSGATTNKWFNRWAKGEIFKDIPKPILSDDERQKIIKTKYL